MASKEDLFLALKNDIYEKLYRLELLLLKPRIVIDDYFRELRLKIDIHTEEKLEADGQDPNSKVNKRRDEMINLLTYEEKKLQKEMIEWDQGTVTSIAHKCSLWRTQADQAFRDEQKTLDDLEDLREFIEKQVDKEAFKLERALLKDQTFIFVKKLRDGFDSGYLFHIVGYYVQHTTFFEHMYHYYDYKNSRHLVEERLKNSYVDLLLVELFLSGLNNQLFEMNCIFKIDAGTFNQELKDENHQYQLRLIDSEIIHSVPLYFSKTKASRLSPPLFEFIAGARMLYLNDNELDEFDEQGFKRLRNLELLEMYKTFAVDVAFSLDFLASYSKLAFLTLTMPKGKVDLTALSELQLLESLELYGYTSRDVNLEWNLLTKQSVEVLSKLANLQYLSLAYFEFDEIQKHAFSAIEKLVSLNLRHNKIHNIDQHAFGSLPLGANTICFEDNQIFNDCELPFFSKFQSKDPNQKSDGQDMFGPESSSSITYTISCSNLGLTEIKRNQFDNSLELERLTLTKNPIVTIVPHAFSQNSLLFSLNLSGCNLKTINNLMFTGLKQLNNLNLSGNLIESIELFSNSKSTPSNLTESASLNEQEIILVQNLMFKDLTCLENLDLSHNKLRKLDLNVFQNLTSLVKLDLSHNLIQEINQNPMRINQSFMKELKLGYNQLTSISKESISSFMNISLLDLSNNKLERLEDVFFQQFSSLSELNLSSNELEIQLSGDTFSSRQLSRLTLHGNRSIEITKSSLVHLVNLKELSVGNCWFPLDNLLDEYNLDQLEHLAIKNPKQDIVQHLKRLTSTHLGSLSVLCLVFHSIDSLEGIDLGKCRMLNTLVLSFNQIVKFEMEWIHGLEHLEKLDLSNNLIKEFDFQGLFQMHHIKELNLSGNMVDRIKRSYFSNANQLELLDLSRNQLSQFDSLDIFSDLVSLRIIKLSGNGIRHMDLRRLFFENLCLHSIDLSNNLLDNDSINARAFEKLSTNLYQLNLENNRLRDFSFVMGLEKLRDLDLSRNETEGQNGNDLFDKLGKLTELSYFKI